MFFCSNIMFKMTGQIRGSRWVEAFRRQVERWWDYIIFLLVIMFLVSCFVQETMWVCMGEMIDKLINALLVWGHFEKTIKSFRAQNVSRIFYRYALAVYFGVLLKAQCWPTPHLLDKSFPGHYTANESSEARKKIP